MSLTKKIMKATKHIPFAASIYRNSPLPKYLEEKRYAYCLNLPKEDYPDVLKKIFKSSTGRELNLENPQGFDEKIQWLKLYNSTPLKTKLADKYLVREWVAEKIGDEYLIPLLGVWNSFDEIDFRKLPNQFILKTNHRCAQNLIVRNKQELNPNEAKLLFDKWLSKPYGVTGFELHYFDIPRKIIAETYLENEGGNLYDYKIHCFGGKAMYIQYIGGRAEHTAHEGWFDREWNLMPFGGGNYPLFISPIPKPKNLELLLSLSEKLAQSFTYVRVDFYVLNDGSFKFGEMTFTPAGGYHKWISCDSHTPEYWDKYLGDLIKLPTNKL